MSRLASWPFAEFSSVELDGSVLSFSHVFWSLVDEPQTRSVIEGGIQELHQFYRGVTKTARAYPVPSAGPQSN
jgi:hypothetical protein